MILVEVLRGMDWPAEMWKELSSALKEIIQEVIKDQEVHIVFPYLCEGIDKKEGFLAIEIFTEGGYDERLAIKQRVECRIKEQFFLGGPPPSAPFQVSVLQCFKA